MTDPARPAGLSDPTPLYHKIFTVLREQILENQFPPEAPLPSEMDLARQFSVSRITIRKAMERLEQQGLITRQRGRGTFAARPVTQRAVQADVSGLVENLLSMGMMTDVSVLELDYVPAPPAVAADMGIEPGTVVQYAVRLRSYRGRPFSYAVTHVPEDIGRTYDAEDLVRTSLLRLFERAGVAVASAYQRVSAKAADATTAPLLDQEIGAPLLSIARLVRDQNDRVVERIHALYPPSQYAFETNLTLGEGPHGTLWRSTPSI
jgi:GntR family transcriptional regulator